VADAFQVPFGCRDERISHDEAGAFQDPRRSRLVAGSGFIPQGHDP
jgi:hypothetical protein